MAQIAHLPFKPSSVYQVAVGIGSRANRLLKKNPKRLSEPLLTSAIWRRRAAVGDPIILIGGYASMPESLKPLLNSLREDGFRRVYVFEVPEYGLADIRLSAEKLADFVNRVKLESASSKVDLVAHSAGGIVARQFVQENGGASSVDSLVTIATPHRGVRLLGSQIINALVKSPPLKWLAGEATNQLLEGSDLLKRLNSAESFGRAQQVRMTSILVDGNDGLLVPIDTAVLKNRNAINVRLRHPGVSVKQADLGHFTLHRTSSRVYDAVRAALLIER